MRVLPDINILLDVLLKREPYSPKLRPSGRLMMKEGLRARRLAGLEVTRAAVSTCLEAFEICVGDRSALEQGKILPGSDFEDNLQVACAAMVGIDASVTRDLAGFRLATITVLAPVELLARLSPS